MSVAPAPGAEKRAARIAVAALFTVPFLVFWQAALGLRVFAPGDSTLYFYPARMLLAKYLRAGELPLWNPYIFSGMPFLGVSQMAVLYPANLLFLVLPPVWAMNLQMITTYSIAALGTYCYARAIGCSVLGASFGGLTYAFCGFGIGHQGHTGILQAAAWMPFLLFCLERLRHSARTRFVAGGAAVIALAIFAGHPQGPFEMLFVGALYSAFFIAAGAPIGRWRFGLVAGATLAAGVLLSAAQLVPTAELAAQSVRAQLSYADFTSYSLPLSQVPMLLVPFLFGATPWVPYWGAWGGIWELLGYVGLLPLMLVLAALPRLFRERGMWFWLGLVGFAFLMVLGDRTPLAWLMYHVPVYNLFRVASRHFVLFDLALAALAARSLTLLPVLPVRQVAGAALAVLAAVTITVVAAVSIGVHLWVDLATAALPGGFADPVLRRALAFDNPALLLPVGLGALGCTALVALRRRPSLLRRGAVLAIQTADLAIFTAVVPSDFPRPDQVPYAPPYIRELAAADGAPGGFRLVTAKAGDYDVGRYDYALMGVPLIGGYEPLLPARYNALVQMPFFGAIGDSYIADAPPVLDLLDARYLQVVYPGRRSSLTTAGHPEFARQRLDLDLSPGMRLEFELPLDCRATGLAIASVVRDADGLPAGAPVARVTVVDAKGRTVEQLLRMGEHTASMSAASEAAALPVFDTEPIAGGTAPMYRGRVDWSPPIAVRRVILEALDGSAALHLARLSLFDAGAGAFCPLTPMHLLASRPDRWERVYGDGFTAVWRNRKSLPRAWLVPRTLSLPADSILAAVQQQRLPDGGDFDPRAVALVEGAPAEAYGPRDQSDAVEITAFTPNAIELRSRSRTPAFLVLSEAFYPGWAADVDGASVPIVRTDYDLRGLSLPAGEHRIRFVYRPRSVAIGLAVSVTTALALAGAAVWLHTRRPRRGAERR
jgi:hypothetical protein